MSKRYRLRWWRKMRKPSKKSAAHEENMKKCREDLGGTSLLDCDFNYGKKNLSEKWWKKRFPKTKGQSWKEKCLGLDQENQALRDVAKDLARQRDTILDSYSSLQGEFISRGSKSDRPFDELLKYISNLEKEVVHWKEKAMNFNKFHK